VPPAGAARFAEEAAAGATPLPLPLVGSPAADEVGDAGGGCDVGRDGGAGLMAAIDAHDGTFLGGGDVGVGVDRWLLSEAGSDAASAAVGSPDAQAEASASAAPCDAEPASEAASPRAPSSAVPFSPQSARGRPLAAPVRASAAAAPSAASLGGVRCLRSGEAAAVEEEEREDGGEDETVRAAGCVGLPWPSLLAGLALRPGDDTAAVPFGKASRRATALDASAAAGPPADASSGRRRLRLGLRRCRPPLRPTPAAPSPPLPPAARWRSRAAPGCLA